MAIGVKGMSGTTDGTGILSPSRVSGIEGKFPYPTYLENL
jgi:hypothetical protein